MKLSLKYFFFLAILLTAQAKAQLQFSITVDTKEIGRKDEIQVDYVVSGTGNVSRFSPPFFDKWKVISGPDFSSFSYEVNGRKEESCKYTYVLAASSTGLIKLPGTSVEANGKKLRCNDVTINVKKEDHVEGVPPPGSSLQFQGGLTMRDDSDEEEFAKEYVLKPGEDPTKKIRSNLFVRAIPSKTKVYVGEPVMVSYKLYTRLKSHSSVVKQPTFTGCSVHEMTTNDVFAEKEKINGKTFNSYLFRKVQLFPLQPGKISIGKASVENTITFLAKSSDLRNLYYDMPVGDEHTLILSTDSFSIEVMPLPKNAGSLPVGDFTISTKLKKDTSAANETNALLVTIEGKGNFKSVTEPEIKWPAALYHFDAVETEDIDKLSFPLTGKKTFEIPFEANNTGKIEIERITLQYFDPLKGVVKTTQSSPLSVTVTPAVKTNIQQAATAINEPRFNTNILFYLVLVVFVAGALFIWKRPKKKTEPVAAPVPAEENPPAVTVNIEEKFNDLLLVQGDAAFYTQAGSLAKEMIRAGMGDNDLLLKVLHDCNTMLYTPMPITSKKEVLNKLRQAMA